MNLLQRLSNEIFGYPEGKLTALGFHMRKDRNIRTKNNEVLRFTFRFKEGKDNFLSLCVTLPDTDIAERARALGLVRDYFKKEMEENEQIFSGMNIETKQVGNSFLHTVRSLPYTYLFVFNAEFYIESNWHWFHHDGMRELVTEEVFSCLSFLRQIHE